MNRFWEILIVPIQIIFVLLYLFGGPLTFVYLIYIDAQTSNTFLQWLGLIICNVILAAIWPIYWLIEFIKYIFS